MLLSVNNEEYSFESKIGEGAFSEVFKVLQKSSKQYFAAKRLLKYFENAKEVEEYSELKVLKQVTSHKNVASIVDHIFETDCSRLTIIFPLMDYSLYDYIKDRKRTLSETRCKNYLFQLGHGLLYLHVNGIFHRDIKPENCLLKLDPQLAKTNPLRAEVIQLADLGSSTFVQYPLPRSEYVSTRWYRSPECILSPGYYGPKMDIWALGCVFYEMFTLHPLFPGRSEADQLDKIHFILGKPSDAILERFNIYQKFEFRAQKAIDLYKFVPMLSAYGVDILKRTLAYHPDNRISTRKLLEHGYFDDLRKKVCEDTLTSRLLFTKSQSGPSSKLKKTNTNLSSSGSLDGYGSKVQALQEFSNHRLERNWNNPKGSIKNSKSSVVGAD